MSDIYRGREENLRILADQIGDILIPFLPPERRMEGIAPEQRMEGIAPEERIDGLDVEDLEALSRVINEQMRWHWVHQADSAARRINVIKDMSRLDRLAVLSQDNREQLLEGLDEGEQTQLLSWIESQETNDVP